jgi:hypothetical protein
MRAGRRDALAQALTPARLRESLAVVRPPSLRNACVAGLQAALGVVLAAALARISPWPQLAGFATLGALAALFGRFAPPQARGRIVAQAGVLLAAPVALLSALAWQGVPQWLLLLALAAVAGVVASLAHRAQLGAPGAVIFVFAASAAIAPTASGAQALARTAAVALGAMLVWVLCRATDGLREARPAPPPPAHPPPGLAPGPSARIAACAAAAALLAHAAGLAHPAWAAIGAIAIVQGGYLPGAVHRAWQRTLGTLLGAALAWWLLSRGLSFWQVVLAVAVLQVLTEAVIGFNYALGQVLVTPMALLMTSLATPGAPADMALSRIADTAVGAVAGVVLALLLSTLDERLHLARHHRGVAHS